MRTAVVFCAILAAAAAGFPVFSESQTVEDAQYRLALSLFRGGRYPEAVVEFERLLVQMETAGYRAACHYYLGASSLSMDRHRAARRHFTDVVDRFRASPFHPPSLYLLGRTEYLMGERQRAIRCFDAYLQAYPSGEYADNSLYWKGEALQELGRREESRAAFREVLRRYPEGGKADAASYKLRLMELEDRLASLSRKPPPRAGGEQEGDALAGEPEEPETPDRSRGQRMEEELGRMQEQEKQYQSRIEQLTNRVGELREEIAALREELRELQRLSGRTGSEREGDLLEQRRRLSSWQELLELKEQALNSKEQRLEEGLQRLREITAELGPGEDE